VTVAVDGDRAYVRTWDTSWKARRMRNNPNVLVAPSTVLGRPRGPPWRRAAGCSKVTRQAARLAPLLDANRCCRAS
jgi:PPOX class probable F420-dependent enzyme